MKTRQTGQSVYRSVMILQRRFWDPISTSKYHGLLTTWKVKKQPTTSKTGVSWGFQQLETKSQWCILKCNPHTSSCKTLSLIIDWEAAGPPQFDVQSVHGDCKAWSTQKWRDNLEYKQNKTWLNRTKITTHRFCIGVFLDPMPISATDKLLATCRL